MSKQGSGYTPSGADDQAFRRRRTHAQIEAMTGLILQALGYPSRRHRDFICALQSVNSSAEARVPHTPFRRAHLTLADYMQLEGSSDTKRKAVYRETVVLRAFTKRTGVLLFHVTPGKEDEATTYIDYLTPAADQAAQRMLASPLWQTGKFEDKQAAKREAVAWAVEQLPRVEPEEEEEECEPVPLDVYAETQDERLCRGAESVADEVARRGGDDDLWLDRHIRKLMKIRSSRKKTAPARRGRLGEGLTTAASAAAAGGDGTVVSGYITGDNSVRTPPASDPASEATPEPAPDASGVRTKVSAPSAPADPAEVPDHGAAALAYARRGWHVFPLHSPDPQRGCTCVEGLACKSPGKHPRTRKGLKDATTDTGQIEIWWRRYPEANVGLAMGSKSGLVAVDVDPRAGGDASLAHLFEEHAPFPPTLEARTGGGGFHFLFSHPGVPFKNSSSVLGEGLDVKTNGGYVVAAPSLHASSKRYEWSTSRQPARMPKWLLSLLTTERPKAAPEKPREPGGAAPAAAGPHILAGRRNEQLFRIGCALRNAGSTKDEIAAELVRVNAARCVPPLDEGEINRIAASAARYVPAASKPRMSARAEGRA